MISVLLGFTTYLQDFTPRFGDQKSTLISCECLTETIIYFITKILLCSLSFFHKGRWVPPHITKMATGLAAESTLMHLHEKEVIFSITNCLALLWNLMLPLSDFFKDVYIAYSAIFNLCDCTQCFIVNVKFSDDNAFHWSGMFMLACLLACLKNCKFDVCRRSLSRFIWFLLWRCFFFIYGHVSVSFNHERVQPELSHWDNEVHGYFACQKFFFHVNFASSHHQIVINE